jgi:non-ribosomal peptide synthetase component F
MHWVPKPLGLSGRLLEQVNDRANQLAHHLIGLGVSAGTAVVVMMDKVSCPPVHHAMSLMCSPR